jgi:hypothetical protein
MQLGVGVCFHAAPGAKAWNKTCGCLVPWGRSLFAEWWAGMGGRAQAKLPVPQRQEKGTGKMPALQSQSEPQDRREGPRKEKE